MWLTLLPFAALVSLWLAVWRSGRAVDPLAALPYSLVLWGLSASLMVEGLGAFHALTRTAMATSWAVILVVGIGVTVANTSREIRLNASIVGWLETKFERWALGSVLVILLTTALVAWLTPPQTWDSLNYHMPRVAHWTQQQSVAHYATGIEVQNSRPPGGEELLLHAYILGDGDRLVTFVGWLSFVASLGMIALITRDMGEGKWSWSLAVLFAASLPMGIIQASSTVNDVVVGMWVLIFAWATLNLRRTGPDSFAIGVLASSGGLALLTKPTAVAYLIPFAIWTGIRLIRRHPVRSWSAEALGGVAIVIVLNAPHLIRNRQTYGSFLQPDQFEIHSNQIRTPAAVGSNLLRNAALHASTPVPEVNKAVFLAVAKYHEWAGLDLNDPRTTSHEPFRVHSLTTHEERSGNPLHAFLILFIVGWVIVRRPDLSRDSYLYLLSTIASMFILSYLFQWQVFASRYHLPFFFLWAPVFGRFSAQFRAPWMVGWMVVLLMASVPWLVSIRSRPLLPLPGHASAPSVLRASRHELYFANAESLLIPYTEITGLIQERSCKSIGLAISGAGAEYPIWSLSDAPDPSLQIEWIVEGTDSDKYMDPSFEPCAVVCQGCAPQARFSGLPLEYERSGFQLFAEPSSEG